MFSLINIDTCPPGKGCYEVGRRLVWHLRSKKSAQQEKKRNRQKETEENSLTEPQWTFALSLCVPVHSFALIIIFTNVKSLTIRYVGGGVGTLYICSSRLGECRIADYSKIAKQDCLQVWQKARPTVRKGCCKVVLDDRRVCKEWYRNRTIERSIPTWAIEDQHEGSSKLVWRRPAAGNVTGNHVIASVGNSFVSAVRFMQIMHGWASVRNGPWPAINAVFCILARCLARVALFAAVTRAYSCCMRHDQVFKSGACLERTVLVWQEEVVVNDYHL